MKNGQRGSEARTTGRQRALRLAVAALKKCTTSYLFLQVPYNYLSACSKCAASSSAPARKRVLSSLRWLRPFIPWQQLWRFAATSMAQASGACRVTKCCSSLPCPAMPCHALPFLACCCSARLMVLAAACCWSLVLLQHCCGAAAAATRCKLRGVRYPTLQAHKARLPRFHG